MRARTLARFTGGVLAAAVLAGCSGGSEDPTATSETPSASTSMSASASESTTQSPSQSTPAPETPSPTSSSAPMSGLGLDPVALAGSPKDVVTGLDVPWSVVWRNGVALVSERDSGRIREVLADGGTRTIGTVPGVEAIGESGLLGLAVDKQGRLYAYSTGQGGNRVHRFGVTGAPGSLGLTDRETIISGIPSAATHDGGRLAFGPDGMLYVSTGDATQRGLSQDLDSRAGKILRLTPDGTIPADNPFPDSPVYSYGHRNVQGLAWTSDGRMWATEFGQNTWDELNLIKAGGNYGWPVVEGIAQREGYEDPVQQWRPADASPSGMAAVGGTLFIANLRGQVLREVPVAEPSTSKDHFTDQLGRLRDVALSPDGDLWVVTSNTDGRGRVRAGDDRIVRVALED